MARGERVFWSAWVVLALGLIVASLLVGRRGTAGERFANYLPDESRPEVVVHNAYVAALRNDVDRFLGYFKEPLAADGRVAALESVALRNGELRLQDVQVTDDTAVVKVLWVHSVAGFLWGPEVRVEEAEVHLERVGERWLIKDRDLPFVYVVWEVPPKPVPPGGD